MCILLIKKKRKYYGGFRWKGLVIKVTAEGTFLLSSQGFPTFYSLSLFILLWLLQYLPWTCQQHLKSSTFTSTASHPILNRGDINNIRDIETNVKVLCQRGGVLRHSPILQSLAMPFSFSRLFLKSAIYLRVWVISKWKSFFFSCHIKHCSLAVPEFGGSWLQHLSSVQSTVISLALAAFPLNRKMCFLNKMTHHVKWIVKCHSCFLPLICTQLILHFWKTKRTSDCAPLCFPPS